jgi:hypothetical protein
VPCNTTISQNSTYGCQLNLTDSEGNGVTVTQIFNGTEIFNVSLSGAINFTATQNDVGSHAVLFTATDNSGCSDNETSLLVNFAVVNINDAPYLARQIPDQDLGANASVSFFLTDYFADPDGDPMTFVSTTPIGVTVTVYNSSQVVIVGLQCGITQVVTFTAYDPYNASAESNPISVTVSCSQAGSSSSASSGGGGGGGGSSRLCKEEWDCDEWFACLPSNFQWRRCYDKNGCNPEQYLKRSCEYGAQHHSCTENWLCAEWSACLINESQVRTCDDLVACNSTVLRPPLSQKCTYDPTCNDGVRNGNETGIDCGGTCQSCALIQKPSAIAESTFPMWALVGIILSVLLVSGILHYYRGQIAQLVAQLGFMMRNRVAKDVLLNEQQRKDLFALLLPIEPTIKDIAGKKAYAKIAAAGRSYCAEALQLPLEMNEQEVTQKLEALGVLTSTKELILGLFSKVELLEQHNLESNEYFASATLEELRTLICLTSDYRQEEIGSAVEEITIFNKMSFYDEVFARATNAMRALQFHQQALAEKEYLEILAKYELLSREEQEQLYSQLRTVFTAVKLQSEIVGVKMVHQAT